MSGTRRSATTTAAPSSWSLLAVAAPMPLAAPVTITALFVNLLIGTRPLLSGEVEGCRVPPPPARSVQVRRSAFRRRQGRRDDVRGGGGAGLLAADRGDHRRRERARPVRAVAPGVPRPTLDERVAGPQEGLTLLHDQPDLAVDHCHDVDRFGHVHPRHLADVRGFPLVTVDALHGSRVLRAPASSMSLSGG